MHALLIKAMTGEVKTGLDESCLANHLKQTNHILAPCFALLHVQKPRAIPPATQIRRGGLNPLRCYIIRNYIHNFLPNATFVRLYDINIRCRCCYISPPPQKKRISLDFLYCLRGNIALGRKHLNTPGLGIAPGKVTYRSPGSLRQLTHPSVPRACRMGHLRVIGGIYLSIPTSYSPYQYKPRSKSLTVCKTEERQPPSEPQSNAMPTPTQSHSSSSSLITIMLSSPTSLNLALPFPFPLTLLLVTSPFRLAIKFSNCTSSS